MTVDLPHIVAPRAMPDGTVSWEEQRPDVAQRIREGDATLGWLGDPLLSLACTPDFEGTGVPRWEVWRNSPGCAPEPVAFKRGLLEPDQLIRNLAAHDSRTHDLAAELLAARDQRTERVRKDGHELHEGNADKLAWALGKDLGAPAQSGRMFGTGR
jgi:hypothetical protein